MKKLKQRESAIRVAIVAGGTGGHIMPALALGEALDNIGYSVETDFYCGNRPLERSIYAEAGLEPRVFPIGGMTRGGPARRVLQGVGLGRSFFRSMRLMRGYDLVVGMGGYVSAPALTAAWMAGVPIVLHESNSVLGRVNRMLAPKARAIVHGMPLASVPRKTPSERLHPLGTPVRLSVVRGDRDEAAASMFLRTDAFTILICGGSQGAQGLNRFLAGAMAHVGAKWTDERPLQVIWSTGPKHLDDVRERLRDLSARGQYWIAPTIDRMDHAFALADLVIGRAGASFLAEVTMCGVPSVLFPLPSAVDRHQHLNAAVLEGGGAAEVYDETTADPDDFAADMLDLVADRKDLDTMARSARRLAKPGASRDMARLIVEIVLGERP